MKTIIFITGLGGSGTRSYGQILQTLGIYLGNNTNDAFDNLNTFFKTGYYKNIKNKFNNKNFIKFKKIFKQQIKSSGYLNHNIFCVKEPNFHIFLHFLKKFSKEEEYNLIVFHIVRDGLYMVNSKNKAQSNRWKHLFQKKYKYINNKLESLEYWYYANKRAIDILKNNNINHLILSYDNLVDNPKDEIIKILSKLNMEDHYKLFKNFNLKKHKNRTNKVELNKLPDDLQSSIIEINNMIH